MSDIFKVIILAFLILTSCDSTDDSSEISGTLEGTWKLEARIFDGSRESLTECELLQTVSFDAAEQVDLFWLDTPPCEFSQFTGTYILSGEQLSVNLPQWVGNTDAFTANYRVLLLDDVNLRVELLNDSERGDYPDTEKTILVFNKVTPE